MLLSLKCSNVLSFWVWVILKNEFYHTQEIFKVPWAINEKYLNVLKIQYYLLNYALFLLLKRKKKYKLRYSFSRCFIIFRFVFISSSIHSHYRYQRFFLPLDKWILVDFFHFLIFCASTGIFQLWSWIERNWS